MSGDNCPAGCKHKTFHYCEESGTHCDIHCVCPCFACAQDRKNPMPVGKSGGKILSGNVIGSHPDLPDYSRPDTRVYIFSRGAVEITEKRDGFMEAYIFYGGTKWKSAHSRPNGDPLAFANEILEENPSLGDWYPESMVNDVLRSHSSGYSTEEIERRTGKKPGRND